MLVASSGGPPLLKIVATVKLVPDTNAEKRIDPATKRLVRAGVEIVMNPFDEYAIEAALQLKEKLGGDTTVTVFSMTPESSREVLRKALAMGADDALVLSDPALEGSDVVINELIGGLKVPSPLPSCTITADPLNNKRSGLPSPLKSPASTPLAFSPAGCGAATSPKLNCVGD